jgi:hypothetical protein
MKKNIFLFLFMVFIATLARAEKTYVKDRAECVFNDEKVVIDIRSGNYITDSEDDSYGEIIQLKHEDKEYTIKSNEAIPSRYRIFRGNSDLCSKALALKINNDTFAVFTGKDNRPFGDKINVLYLNVKNKTFELVPTKIISNTAFILGTKAYFKLSYGDGYEKVGSVIIENAKYSYLEKILEPWISFDGKNFQLEGQMTYERFEHKGLLKKSKIDGLSLFIETKYKVASQLKTGKKCISINDAAWECR